MRYYYPDEEEIDETPFYGGDNPIEEYATLAARDYERAISIEHQKQLERDYQEYLSSQKKSTLGESNIMKVTFSKKFIEKKLSGMKGKEKRDTYKDTRKYRSSGLDNYDTSNYGDAGYEEYTTTATNASANGFITDKNGNEYDAQLKEWSSDAGSYANAILNYSVKIFLDDTTTFERNGSTGFMRKGDDLSFYHDFLGGMYLEDYLAKFADITYSTPRISGENKEYWIEVAKTGDPNAVATQFPKKKKNIDKAETFEQNFSRYRINDPYSKDGKLIVENGELIPKNIFPNEEIKNIIENAGFSLADFEKSKIEIYIDKDWQNIKKPKGSEIEFYKDNNTGDVSAYIEKEDKDGIIKRRKISNDLLIISIKYITFDSETPLYKDLIELHRKSVKDKHGSMSKYVSSNTSSTMLDYKKIYPKDIFGRYDPFFKMTQGEKRKRAIDFLKNEYDGMINKTTFTWKEIKEIFNVS